MYNVRAVALVSVIFRVTAWLSEEARVSPAAYAELHNTIKIRAIKYLAFMKISGKKTRQRLSCARFKPCALSRCLASVIKPLWKKLIPAMTGTWFADNRRRDVQRGKTFI
jgi:hypothetical protein